MQTIVPIQRTFIQPRILPMPETVKNLNLDKALTAYKQAVHTDRVDFFHQIRPGQFECKSETYDKQLGIRHFHQIRTAVEVLRDGFGPQIVVKDCSHCQGWSGPKKACRHANKLTGVLNHALILPWFLDNPNAELSHAF